ncbi:MAG: fumarylacetoacetate hydrolase family protein [Hyphomicrobiaceae bacterium]
MPLSEHDVETFARNLLLARRTPGTKPLPPPAIPETDKDAYRIQDRVIAAYGPVEGWKVGAANPTAEPNCAPIIRSGLVQLSAAPIQVPSPVGIEVEIGFRMNRAFPSANTPPTEQDVLSNIKSTHVVMELCASRLPDGSKSPPLANLADNGMNQAFVIGPEVKNWRNIDAVTQVARAIVNGKTVVETTGGHTQKDIGALLVWLVRHVVMERNGLAAGAFVAAGSWTGIHWLDAPALVGGEFEGLGRLDCVLGPQNTGPRII